MKFAPLVLTLIGIALAYSTMMGAVRHVYPWSEAIILLLILPGMILFSAFRIWQIQRRNKTR